MNEIIAAATDIGDGDPVSIDLERSGWQVQLWSEQDESEVQVVDGVATVISTEPLDADDQAPRGVLDADAIDALVEAALSEVDGTVTSVDVDENTVSPYDVTVLTRAGESIDISLDADFTVTRTENEGIDN